MISLITGKIADVDLDLGTATVSANGVGYEVFATGSVLGLLREKTEDATLHVFTKVREDAITLFGFLDKESKRVFTTLLSVSGVGPKVALAILDTYEPGVLAAKIDAEDDTWYKPIKGVGPKLGKPLTQTLKGKLDFVQRSEGASVLPTRKGANRALAIDGLKGLGIGLREAEELVYRSGCSDDDSVESIITMALKSRGKLAS